MDLKDMDTKDVLMQKIIEMLPKLDYRKIYLLYQFIIGLNK